MPSASVVLVTAPHLGQLLKTARKRQKLTQSEIANQLSLSQNRISYLELHPEDVSVRQLLSWCAILKLELSIGERSYVPLDNVEW
jgi:HTH-type transcriptional regulator/antitoxin HipB